MKTVLSSLIALAVLAGVAAPANAFDWGRKGYASHSSYSVYRPLPAPKPYLRKY
jgi:hypothetical protein